MNVTFRGLLLLPPLHELTGPDDLSSPTASPTPFAHSRAPGSIPTEADHNPSGIPSRTSLTGSTVWGPGALVGKLLKWIGNGVEGSAVALVISRRLRKIERLQPDLVVCTAENSTSPEVVQIQEICRTLVELCIMELRYPAGLMTRAFKLILNGLQLPGRQTWSYYIAEAISEREIVEVYEFFLEGFFALLDDSIFRLKGLIDHDILCFRRPIVTQEVAAIISYLALKDLSSNLRPTCTSLSVVSSGTIHGEFASHLRPTFSRAIIEAGFLRLAGRWVESGLPHWDEPGVKRLESALKNVADALDYHGDRERAGEAKEIILKLQGRNLPPENG